MNKEIEVRVGFGMLVAAIVVSILTVSAASAPTVLIGSAIAEEGETGTVPLMCLTVPEGDYTVNVTGFNRTTGLSVVNTMEVITVTSVLSSDTTAPTTVVSAPPDKTPIPSGTVLPWTNTTVQLDFNRSDNGGGDVEYTNISVTGVYTMSWPTLPGAYSGITLILPANKQGEGETTVWYYSVDKSGNIEATKNVTLRYDVTDPVINSVELDTTMPGASGPLVVTVNGTDAVSGIAKVTANGVELTPQAGNLWNGTLTAEFLPGTYNVTVIAADNAGNTVTNDTMQYTVQEEYCVGLTVDKLGESIMPGETATYTLTVNNTGNVNNTINMTIVIGPGTLSKSSVNLTPKASEDVTLNVTSTVVGTHVTRVNATSQIDTNETVNVIVTTAIGYGVDLQVDKPGETIVQGETATYTLTVNNTGNVLDTINLTVESGIGTLSTSSVALDAGASEAVTLNVTNNTVGDYVTTVNATSQGDATKYATVTVTTIVEAPRYGVDLTVDKITATIVQGGTATYTLTVNNTGNMPDTINLTVEAGIGTETLNPSSVTVDAGASEDVTLEVKSDIVGDHVTTVNATSQTDTNESANVTVITTVEEEVVIRRGGGGAPRDSDGDGYSDVEELLAGTNPNDPDDYPYKPAATPEPTAPAATPTATPTVPLPAQTPASEPTAPAATPTPEEPGFEGVFAVAGLLAVAYLILRLKK